MTRPFNAPTLAAGALVLALGAGCGGSTANSSPTLSSNPGASAPAPISAATSPSASTPPTRSEIAAADAATTVQRYFKVLDEVRQQPSSPLARLAGVTTSTQLLAERQLVSRERHQGLRQTGATRVDQLKVRSVHLRNGDAAIGEVPTVLVDVCWDVSKADLVDRNGHSVVSSKRPDTGWTRYTVANYHWAADPTGGWRIATSQDLKKTPCAAS